MFATTIPPSGLRFETQNAVTSRTLEPSYSHKPAYEHLKHRL